MRIQPSPRMIVATLALAAAAAAPAAGVMQSKPTDRLLVGLVRSEGVIVPFAEYAAGRWTNAGADAGRSQSAVPSVWFVRGAPAPHDWSVVFVTGARRSAETNTATLVQSHCSPQWGLLSDIGDQPVPIDTLRRQVGVAISGPATLDGFEEIDRASPDTARIAAAVQATFDRDEDAALARWSAAGLGSLPPASDRHAIPLLVESGYRSRISIGGQTLLSVRLSRSHRSSSGACNRVSVLDTWVFEDDQGHAAISSESRFALADCARRDERTTVPLGVVRVDGRAYVVGAEYAGDSETYRVFSVDGDAVRSVLATFGGSC